jgi:hypothetical protein
VSVSTEENNKNVESYELVANELHGSEATNRLDNDEIGFRGQCQSDSWSEDEKWMCQTIDFSV